MIRSVATVLLLTLLGASAQDVSSNGLLSKPKLTPEALERSITTSALKFHARAFQTIADLPKSNGTREFGTYGYNASVAYVWNALKLTGAYNLQKHSVLQYAAVSFSRSLTVNNVPEPTFLDFLYSPATPEAGITAQLVLVPDVESPPSAGCTEADWAGVDVQGKIAVIQRGSCSFVVKVEAASKRGAIGIIIYNQLTDPLLAPSLGAFQDYFIPTGFLQKPEGDALAARLTGGEDITVNLKINSTLVERWSQNVIATSKVGNQSNLVFAGSHLDSVRAGPGINDNASGTTLNLEIALHLAKYTFNNAVRFAWWTAEEIGLVGAHAYVDSLSDEERSKIALYLNYDMVGSPNYVISPYDGDNSAGTNEPNQPGPAGSAEIEAAYQDYFKLRRIPTVPKSFNGRSDYGAFLPYGIASGGLSTGSDGIKTPEQAALFGGQAGIIFDPNYHKVGDRYENVNFTALTIMAKAAAYVIAEFANSTAVIEAARAPGAAQQRKPPVVSTNDALVVTDKPCDDGPVTV